MTLVISQGPDSFLISHETVEFAIIIIYGSEKCYLTLRDPTIDVICFSLPERFIVTIIHRSVRISFACH